MSDYSRTQRISDALQRELAVLIRDEIRDPRVGMVNVTGAEVSRDLSNAKVFVTFVGHDTEEQSHKAAEVLNGAAGFLRSLVAKSMELRSTPKLRFIYDKSVRHGQHLEALIEKAVFDDVEKRHVSDDEQSERDGPETDGQ